MTRENSRRLIQNGEENRREIGRYFIAIGISSFSRRLSHHIHDEGHDKDNQEDIKQDFGYAGKATGDAPKSQHPENKGQYSKGYYPSDHDGYKF
ncbi:MAG TPA: hypothetical protein VKY29_00235 [Cryomorphaceae bacterium]|nr:hypothetical protein [Cryomorphaceae bacterium]